jgi:hypothetical protein
MTDPADNRPYVSLDDAALAEQLREWSRLLSHPSQVERIRSELRSLARQLEGRPPDREWHGGGLEIQLP